MRKVRTAVAAGLLAAVAAAAGAQQKNDGEAQFNSALTNLREGRASLALEDFKRAIRMNGKNPYFYKGIGICYMQLQRFPEAVDALRRALQLNPYYVDARNDLGTALLMVGKRDEGKAELLAAFNDPTNPTPELSARNLGQAYLQEKRWPDAASWFRSSLGRNFQLVDAHLGLNDALLAQNRTDEAVHAMEDAVKALPEAPALLVALGEAYYRAGRFHDAQARLEEAKAKDRTGAVSRKADALLKQFSK
jgi:tetratricopeptide (TPR) repeat protein